VSVAAQLNESDPKQLPDLYKANVRLLIYVAFPMFSVAAAWSPLLSEVWIGTYEVRFCFFVVVLAVTQCINTFAGPAYFANLGTGHVGVNTATHVVMCLVNAALGIILGAQFGATGIALAMIAATAAGTVFAVSAFQRKHELSWRVFAQVESSWLVACCVCTVAVVLVSYDALAADNVLVRLAVCLSLPALILGPPLWRHPLRTSLLGQLKGERNDQENAGK